MNLNNLDERNARWLLKDLAMYGAAFVDKDGQRLDPTVVEGNIRRFRLSHEAHHTFGEPAARAALDRHTNSEGRGNREHLSSAEAAAPPDPETLDRHTQ